jgi:uncharacterized lipoprotein
MLRYGNARRRVDQDTSRRQKSKVHLSRTAGRRAFITAQLAGNEVVYSVVLTKARNPLSREDVESHFEGELRKK